MPDPIVLSAEEMSLVQNAEWILSKRRIIDKVYELFGQVSEGYVRLLLPAAFLPEEVTVVSPKIYKGEAYLQLPYVLLDQPRFFKGQDAFAIRSFFWWGKSFSVHLHLAGKYKKQFEPLLLQHLQQHHLDGWHTVEGKDPWQHHFEDGNYKAIVPDQYEAIATTWKNRDFLKLARTHSLQDWDTAEQFFLSSFSEVLVFLAAN